MGSGASVTLAALGLAAAFVTRGRDKACTRLAALLIALLAVYGGTHYYVREGTSWIGAIGAVACLALFACTAKTYAASRFTIANFFLIGTAHGFTLAVCLAAMYAPHLVRGYALASMALTAVALAVRLASLQRSSGEAPESPGLRFGFIVLGFIAPIVLVHLGVRAGMFGFLAAAALVQSVGVAMERGFFLAQANAAKTGARQSR